MHCVPSATTSWRLLVSEKSTAMNDQDSPAPAFFRIRDVLRITSLSRPTLYRRIAARRFPRPVHLGGRACGWSSAALQQWISDPEGYLAPAAVEAVIGRKRGRPHKYPEY
jgi:prophage regulatory protein